MMDVVAASTEERPERSIPGADDPALTFGEGSDCSADRSAASRRPPISVAHAVDFVRERGCRHHHVTGLQRRYEDLLT